MHVRKGENVSGERVRAMDSSSVVATARVSRSESLFRHVITRFLRSGGGGGGVDRRLGRDIFVSFGTVSERLLTEARMLSWRGDGGGRSNRLGRWHWKSLVKLELVKVLMCVGVLEMMGGGLNIWEERKNTGMKEEQWWWW